MGVGKYSPTVSASYRMDQSWRDRHGGEYGQGKHPTSDLDDDGYDSYGYSGNGDGPDRAGYTEHDYAMGTYDEETDSYHHDLYDRVDREWSDRLLGDLPHYVTMEKLAQLTGLGERQLLLWSEFLFKDVRMITGGLFGTRLYVHGDDVGEITKRAHKYRGH